LVSHSERRALYGEDNALVARKFLAAQAAGLVPVLCVGETLEQRESGATAQVILQQLEAVVALAGIGAFAKAVLAYEPVWAIGTGKTASPAQAQEVHAAPCCVLASPRKMLYWAAGSGFFTVAVSRRRTPRNCSPSRTSMAAS
jgi:triosephosphate isomerase